MAKNIELKLEVKNLDALETLSRALATEPEPQLLNQVDIYYRVKTGRLKLRIINGKRSGESRTGRHLFGHLKEAGFQIVAGGSV